MKKISGHGSQQNEWSYPGTTEKLKSLLAVFDLSEKKAHPIRPKCTKLGTDWL